ncbi:LytR C-terminal domain-containing protein [Saccharomonospora saliphila]|uniref:LytR C-terminal domain-containing protein n=1 Tax=Saccharomonospora saliphila TaxID=369829 RepID=UPI00048C7AB1|nr:LytR C-terminal domain-containing protein [Saccharomonospora saliphila]
MSIFDGVSRPMRATGLGLLAVAVVAAALGGVSLVTGDDPTDTAATETADSRPGEGGGEGSREQGPGDGAQDDGDTDGTPGEGGGDEDDDRDRGDAGDGTDGAGGDDPDTGGGSDGDPGNAQDQRVSVEDAPVRVYNNSDISGLASDTGDDLRARGWNVVEVANYADGIIPASTVYFRPGTDEEPLAHALAEDFGMRVEPRFEGIADASEGVIVIVTRDYDGPVDPK